MAVIQVQVSGFPQAMDLIRPQLPRLAQAFAPYGVQLGFTSGILLTKDPEETGRWDELTRVLVSGSRRSRPPSPAHLVLSGWPPGFDLQITGKLMDSLRGVSAIFLRAGIYGNAGPAGRPDLLAQVCVHELGHMFNLTHTDASGGAYVNGMNQASERWNQTTLEAWRSALDEARRTGEPLATPADPVYCYPFNARCRAQLRMASSDAAWWPYSSPFRGDYQGGENDEDRSLHIEVAVDEDRLSVGSGLYVTLSVGNRSSAPIDLPAYLGPEYESLRVLITGPTGELRWYRPREIRCTSARRVLLPNERFHRSLSMLGSPDEPLFPEPGEYELAFALVDHRGHRVAQLAEAKTSVTVNEDKAAIRLGASLVRRIDPTCRRRPPASADLQSTTFHPRRSRSTTVCSTPIVGEVPRRATLN
jgi:hypothetical protein